ncbi:hypothetical protein [Thiocapsa sp. N5-Cardenillas]|uniref:hypothetical protein n=1 Tax=Thiocapsa sp. N5-Cardenillas TaxID=3137397 RepID=UPI0035B22DB7
MSISDQSIRRLHIRRRWRAVRGKDKLFWRNALYWRLWENGAIACIQSGSSRTYFFSLKDLEDYVSHREQENKKQAMMIEIESRTGTKIYTTPENIIAMEIRRPKMFPGTVEYTIYIANRYEYAVTEAEFERLRDRLESLDRPPYQLSTLGRWALVGNYVKAELDDGPTWDGDDDDGDGYEDGDELEPDEDEDEPEPIAGAPAVVPASAMLAVQEPLGTEFEKTAYTWVQNYLLMQLDPETALGELIDSFYRNNPADMSWKEKYTWFDAYRTLCHYCGLVPLTWGEFSKALRVRNHRGKFADFVEFGDDDGPEPEPMLVAPDDDLPF